MTLRHVVIAALLLGILVLQSRLWFGEGSYAHVAGLSRQVDLRSTENETRRQRNVLLKAEVLDLRDGLEAVEERARSELGLIKKGETFFLVL